MVGSITPFDLAGSAAKGQALGQQDRLRESNNALSDLLRQTPPTTQGNRAQLQGQAFTSGINPQQSFQLVQSLSQMDANERATLKDQTAQAARLAFTIKGLPPEQRANAFQSARKQFPTVFDQEVTDQESMNFALDSTVNEALTLSEMFKQAEGFTLSPGQERRDAQGNLIVRADPKSDLLTKEAFDQKVALAKAGKSETKINFGSEVQNKAATFASRMEAANDTIDELEEVGSDPRSTVGNLMPNVLKSDDLQLLDTVARDFTGAILRKESGAAIPPSEIKEAFRVYIPQPGDGPRTVAIKRGNRARAIQNMRREAGPVESLADVPGIVEPAEEPPKAPLRAADHPENTIATSPDGTETFIVKGGEWVPFDGQ